MFSQFARLHRAFYHGTFSHPHAAKIRLRYALWVPLWVIATMTVPTPGPWRLCVCHLVNWTCPYIVRNFHFISPSFRCPTAGFFGPNSWIRTSLCQNIFQNIAAGRWVFKHTKIITRLCSKAAQLLADANPTHRFLYKVLYSGIIIWALDGNSCSFVRRDHGQTRNGSSDQFGESHD